MRKLEKKKEKYTPSIALFSVWFFIYKVEIFLNVEIKEKIIYDINYSLNNSNHVIIYKSNLIKYFNINCHVTKF